MKAKYIIIAVVVVFVALIILDYYTWNKVLNKSTPGTLESSDVPESVQKELPYFDEGETLSYAGSTFQKVAGSWTKIN